MTGFPAVIDPHIAIGLADAARWPVHEVPLSRMGYYIDVGASQLVIDGEINLRSGVSIAEIKPDSVS